MSIKELTELFQKECWQQTEVVMRTSTDEISYQDATNVWIFEKLAQLQLEINDIRQKGIIY
jgi:hypothetical protein